MRKIFLMIVTLGLVVSCYSDKSASDYAIVAPIVIDFQGTSSVLNVRQLDTLEIKPIVYKEGLDDANLSFEWLIYGNNIVPEVIGTSMSLKAEIAVPVSSVKYDLKYKVTDNTTGLYVEQLFVVYVLSDYKGGLYVADTRDEQTGDLSLIESRNFKSSIEKDTIYRDIYSRTYGSKVESIVTAVSSTPRSVDRMNTTVIGTNKSIERIHPYTMDYLGRDAQLFGEVPEAFNVSAALTNRFSSWNDVIINNGKFHNRIMAYSTTIYSYNFKYADNRDYEVKLLGEYSSNFGGVFSFDELNTNFIYGSLSSGNIVTLPITEEQQAFYKDYTCLHISKIARGNDGYMVYFMKHKTTGVVRSVVFKILILQPYGWYRGAEFEEEFEFDSASFPGINEATAFSQWNSRNILYYASGASIYSVEMRLNGYYKSYLEYTAPAGEVVTAIKTYDNAYMYGQTAYVDYWGNVSSRSSQSNMVIGVTYNETTKEGVVRIFPLKTSATYGEFEKDNTSIYVEFRGFGRITAIGYQHDPAA